MMAAISMVACSMVTGCKSTASSKGGTYANLPDPKPDEYIIHWENDSDEVKVTATVHGGWFGFFAANNDDDAPWMLRDQETISSFGPFVDRYFSLEAKARNAALYKACREKQCDAVIGAMYEVKVDEYGPFYSVATCTLTRGWPARITGIEKVSGKVK